MSNNSEKAMYTIYLLTWVIYIISFNGNLPEFYIKWIFIFATILAISTPILAFIEVKASYRLLIQAATLLILLIGYFFDWFVSALEYGNYSEELGLLPALINLLHLKLDLISRLVSRETLNGILSAINIVYWELMPLLQLGLFGWSALRIKSQPA